MHDRAQQRVDPVRAHDDVARRGVSVLEGHDGGVAELLEPRRAVSRVQDLLRQRTTQQFDQVGPMHPVCGIPSARVRDLNRRDLRAVHAVVPRVLTDEGTELVHRRAETDPDEMANGVRGDVHPGPDLAECGRLFVQGGLDPLRGKRVGEEEASYAASDDHDPFA